VVEVPSGTLLSEAARQAGLEIGQPCGGQGRCGRCAVRVTQGDVRRRSSLQLTPEDLAQGYTLACQSVVERDVEVFIPEQEKIVRRLASERLLKAVQVPAGYAFEQSQSMRRYALNLTPPSLDDQADDWSRLQSGLLSQYPHDCVSAPLSVLRRLGPILRAGDWQVTAILDRANPAEARLIDLRPGLGQADDPLWACAIDIGTTTVTLWLVDLVSGQVCEQCSEYNGQIARGEDVVSRILYASKNGLEEMQRLVAGTINQLAENACAKVGIAPEAIVKATVAGNTTMIHLFLGIPADSIRLAPFIPVVNQPPSVAARELGLIFCPEAVIECLPGVASYVGADITSGVLSSGIAETDLTTLFIDVGTNGETVLGNQDWLMTCACSAGPAFEGAGVVFGMRATTGAIEEVWVNSQTYEPHIRVIGDAKPRGICGSGLISLLAELFLTGAINKAGRFNYTFATPRIRRTEQGGEYVVVWGSESESGEDIVLKRVDIDNVLRAKAAIYAGFKVLCDKVGIEMQDIQQMLIGGSFGKYVNIEKAIQIGMLPDMPPERFKYLGNTAVLGAYLVLLDAARRETIRQDAARMNYVELSADNLFYDAFTSALFLPNTEVERFPSVKAALEKAPREKRVVKTGVLAAESR
jgi:uncharacterized 2Fe-2S/4Fe-4S cluster protein (DUF4445 family)